MNTNALMNAVYFPVDAKHQLSEVRDAVGELSYDELLDALEDDKVRRYVTLAFRTVSLPIPFEEA